LWIFPVALQGIFLAALDPTWKSFTLGIQCRSAFVFLAKNYKRGSTLLAQFCSVPVMAKAVPTSYVVSGLKMSVPRGQLPTRFYLPKALVLFCTRTGCTL
jgi:hypothetical protein